MLSRFRDTGFLAEDMEGVSVAFNSASSKYLQVCRELNSFSHNLQYKLDIHNEDLVEVLFAILFSRVPSTYEAALLVTQRGMKQQVETLIRCTLEPLFPLVATSGDHSFAYKLVKAEEHKQLSAINKLIRYKERKGIYHADLAVANELAKELGTKISREKLPKVNVLDCARRQTLRIDMIQFMP